MSSAARRSLIKMAAVILLLTAACERERPKRKLIKRSPVQKKFVDRPPLVFGVLPATDDAAVRADYEIFTTELSKLLKRKFTLEVAPDYDALINAMVAERVHIAQLSAYLYVRVQSSLSSAEVLVQQRMAWDTEYRGVFVVKNDSPWRELKALGTKRLAYVDRHSSAGFFYPRMRLRALGINPDEYFKGTPFAGSHKKVAEMVTRGAAEVGVLSEQTLSEFLGLRIIDKTDVIPDDAILASTNPSLLSKRELDRMRTFLLSAHEDPRMHLFMNRRGIETYVRPNIEVYAPLAQEMGLTTTVKATGDQNAP